ncbi:hypothetical protein UFOVP124_81 [uncultured Caudovirales phage]|uniref:Uncharacterized protein n=1 Tax=uncultured Caudovirales phage TaxID=2100421 RepID=A0A6J5LEL5_9CAUD|nr:hypothetical protein UFOVP124_81 [uncultured Caudovirales phage]
MPKNKGRNKNDSTYIPRKQRESRTPQQPDIILTHDFKANEQPWILVLDPSSTACGWALFLGETLRRCGVWRAGAGPMESRVDRLCECLTASLPDINMVVVEISSRIAYNARRAKSLPALLYAQGRLEQAARGQVTKCHRVTEQEWTGRKPKHQRAKMVALLEPVYRQFAPRDKGLDAADAVGLGQWWISQQKIRGATA